MEGARQEAYNMEDYQNLSVPALIRSVLDDARELIREEVAVARSEIRDGVSAAQTAGAAFGAAAITGLVAVVLFCVAAGLAIAYVFGWPSWAGIGIVSVLLGVVAYLALRYGQGKLANLQALPKTTATLRENMAWIQDKSTPGASKSR
jgi:hypothetical protein